MIDIGRIMLETVGTYEPTFLIVYLGSLYCTVRYVWTSELLINDGGDRKSHYYNVGSVREQLNNRRGCQR